MLLKTWAKPIEPENKNQYLLPLLKVYIYSIGCPTRKFDYFVHDLLRVFSAKKFLHTCVKFSTVYLYCMPTFQKCGRCGRDSNFLRLYLSKGWKFDTCHVRSTETFSLDTLYNKWSKSNSTSDLLWDTPLSCITAGKIKLIWQHKKQNKNWSIKAIVSNYLDNGNCIAKAVTSW